jgi:branched-chain amino acid transport system ATP-binding protein
VRLRGEDVTARRPQRLLALGVAHVLQGHSVFREMTVEENVRLGAYTVPRRGGGSGRIAERCDQVRDIFPVVAERWRTTAGLLSGGEQKQVELARALMLEPAVLLLDEPSMGLDPKATATVFDQIARLRSLGVAVLLVEQNARRALEMADVGCVLDLGRLHTSGPASELLADPELAALYLGSSAASRRAASDPSPSGPAPSPTSPTSPAPPSSPSTTATGA